MAITSLIIFGFVPYDDGRMTPRVVSSDPCRAFLVNSLAKPTILCYLPWITTAFPM